MGLIQPSAYLAACKCGKHCFLIKESRNIRAVFEDKAGGYKALEIWEMRDIISPEEGRYLRREIELSYLPEQGDLLAFLEVEGDVRHFYREPPPSEWVN